MRRVDATVERLVEVGATVVRIKDEPDTGFYSAGL
ncbi:hypothetical protein AB0P41_20975 [Streptomyces sp. NPDC079167]